MSKECTDRLCAESASPHTVGMLDVVGFNTATLQLISDFARGTL